MKHWNEFVKAILTGSYKECGRNNETDVAEAKETNSTHKLTHKKRR